MEMELLRSQNHELELEILDTKLQLRKLMQTSPEVIHSIESTPLKGGLLDFADNSQEFPRDFPTLDALHMRRNPNTEHPMLPHHFVMSNKGMFEYHSLSISEFVCGYRDMVKLYPQLQDDSYAHLQLLMEKAMTYSWESVKKFHFSCNFLFHQGRISCQQREIITGKASTFFTHGDVRNTQQCLLNTQKIVSTIVSNGIILANVAVLLLMQPSNLHTNTRAVIATNTLCSIVPKEVDQFQLLFHKMPATKAIKNNDNPKFLWSGPNFIYIDTVEFLKTFPSSSYNYLTASYCILLYL